jgi:hypothetical protein
LAVKVKDDHQQFPLDYAKNKSLSETIISVLQILMEKSDYELENGIDIPMVVMFNGIENRRCQEIYQEIKTNIK